MVERVGNKPVTVPFVEYYAARARKKGLASRAIIEATLARTNHKIFIKVAKVTVLAPENYSVILRKSESAVRIANTSRRLRRALNIDVGCSRANVLFKAEVMRKGVRSEAVDNIT